MNPLRRQYVESDIAKIDELIRKTPERRVLERMGLESRRSDLIKELEAMSRAATSANVILSFAGQPVQDAPGISAQFAGAALIEFQNFVSVIDASKTRGIRDVGPIPDKDASALRVVGTVHGSFGFELQEADNPLFASSLSESVGDAARLIAAAGEGDDEFIEAVSEMDYARVQTKLASFLKVLKSARATCKVISEDTEAMLDAPSVDAAVERVDSTKIEEVEEHHEGKFAGVTLDSRHFDHAINEIGGVIKGRVDKRVDRATLAQWDRKWLNKPCMAVVHRQTITRLKKSKTTYTLLRLEPINANNG